MDDSRLPTEAQPVPSRCRTMPRARRKLGCHEPHHHRHHHHHHHNGKTGILLPACMAILASQLLFFASTTETRTMSLNATTMHSARELVRHTSSSATTVSNSEDSQQSPMTSHQPTPPTIPTNFVKLGNNTSVNVRSYNFNNHARQQPAVLASHATTNASDPASSKVLGDNQSSQKRDLFEKVCIGTSNRMSGQSNKTDHYQNLVERYKNCTFVIGNLEITWLERGAGNRPIDLSFLESIREITGYLLIAYVDVERISMPNLQIVRGRDLFKLHNAKEEYAMFVIENELKSLELPNLREILAGDVGFNNNRNLCYISTIEWNEILNPSFKVINYIDRTRSEQPECSKCHESCNSCWGPGPEMCQKFSKTICSPQCAGGRCFGQAPRECCHLLCAGGCTGPKQTDCLACKNFNNDGECIQECPPMRRYNPSKFVWEVNPNGTFAFGATCVRECPDHLLRDNGACVRSCPADKRSHNGECIPCVGQCPKNCQGVDVVNSKNINQLVNCTEIEGSITILDTSFNGYTELNSNNNTMGTRYEPMHPRRLKVFHTIRKITGYLNIQAAHPEFKDLSFFSKLETIGGRQTTDMFHSLSIIKTSLISLNLRSLKKIKSGKVIIEENHDLCFANATQFIKLGIAKEEDITIRNNGNHAICHANGLRCHEQCSPGGCWGYGSDECLLCNNYKLDDYCVSNCTSTKSLGILSFDAGNRTCTKCHPECRGGCSAGSAKNCWQCKSLKDGPYCVSECPSHKYNDNGICQECHKNCVDGCTGPSSRLGEGGCNSCAKIVIDSLSPVFNAHCIKATDQCPTGYYQEYGAPISDLYWSTILERKPVCRRCHSRCKSCTGYGTHKDVCECAGYVANDQCEDSCPRDFYADEKSRHCLQCSPLCTGCFGPTEADCLNCRFFRIYHDQTAPVASARVSEKSSATMTKMSPLTTNNLRQVRFNCSTAQCPADKSYRIVESNSLDPYCSAEPGPDSDSVNATKIGPISLSMIVSFILLSFCISACVYSMRQFGRDHAVKSMAMRMSFDNDVEPLNQSNTSPNLSPMRNILETELKRGHELGEGFGGYVYQGLWTPYGQKDSIPVAIKVLKDNGQSNRNNQFLDEAYIMASVNHPNLVKLYGVCMTKVNFMLITQLMPLGCLLDYVQKHRLNICSKFLLEWSRQIACGMAYLEENQIVHRDLALRNVLMQTTNKVLISDFGLAKLLEADQSEYQSVGGRLPIKWLAPECIREKKFTHKSDVWAFGVTIWELLTFGERPFENYETKDVPHAIEEGARLPQPSYVSAEVYKSMMACWFYQPEDRPNFESLQQDFDRFKRRHTMYMKNPGEASQESEDQNNNNNNNHEEFDGRESDSAESEPYPTLLNITEQHKQFDEAFGLELKHHHSESETPNGHLSTPTIKKIGMFSDHPNENQNQLLEDVFTRTSQQMLKGSNMTITDSNNNNSSSSNSNFISRNNICRSQAESFWSVNQQTTSTSSVGRQKLPTDNDDYLLPSPCNSNEIKFNKFLATHEGPSSRAPLPPTPTSRDPPHSAGLIGISNQEYFLTRLNYVNSSGPHGATNASSGHIPQSLV